MFVPMIIQSPTLAMACTRRYDVCKPLDTSDQVAPSSELPKTWPVPVPQ